VAAQQLAFSFYAAGPLRTYRPEAGGRLTLYALNEAPFDLQELTDHVGALYDHMAGFFGEGEGAYRVIARRNPYRGRGGTALPRSFMFGYHAPSRPTLDDLQAMLSHEIAHAWPSMQGEHGETAWYSEGAAEYYSAVLGRRAGVFSEDAFLAAINRRARNYFAHPFRGMGNAEAAGRFWSDPFAQQVPYGRGFLYLAQTDAAIRAASGGRRSLDDVVLALRALQQADEAYGIPAWLELVSREIGRDRAQRDFERMTSGEIVRPASDFAPCLIAVPERARRLELGFARRSLNDSATVEGLVSSSNAARAGVREGDRILAHTELDELSANPSREMLLTIERDGEQRSLSYLPRAEAVEAYRWVRNPHVAPDQCRI
jgi:predicted metalloprotease with PDZ domain